MNLDESPVAQKINAAIGSPQGERAIGNLVALVARAWVRAAHEERLRIELEESLESSAREEAEDARRQAADAALARPLHLKGGGR